MPSLDQITIEQDQLIAQAIEKDGSRLRNYIRKHVLDRDATEDILQDVFSELVEAYRLLKPIEQVSAWLFRVAKNRIIDRFRGKKLESLSDAAYGEEDDGCLARRPASFARERPGGDLCRPCSARRAGRSVGGVAGRATLGLC